MYIYIYSSLVKYRNICKIRNSWIDRISRKREVNIY